MAASKSKQPDLAGRVEERLRPLLDRIDAVPDTDLPTDKAFFDELSGEP